VTVLIPDSATLRIKVDVHSRSLLDHATTWLAAVFVGLYGLVYFVALATPEPAGTIRDGIGGVVIWPAIGSLYGAAAILQQEYNLVHGWRPSWRQGITLSWVGGWTLLIVLGVIGSFVSRGASAAFASLGFGLVFLGLFVGLPWVIAKVRQNASAQSDRAFLD
jgi:hypothetical protein